MGLLISGRLKVVSARRIFAAWQRENSFIWSASDNLYVDLTPKGIEESWARLIQNLQQNSESI